jgi:uncharacterized iron-regulated membrane protein
MIRTILIKIHLYASMLAGAFLLVIAGSGCLLAFGGEIERFLKPNLWKVAVGTRPLPLGELLVQVRKTYPRAKVRSFLLPMRDDEAFIATLNDGRNVFLNPFTGRVLGDQFPRDSFISKVRQLHAKLLFGYIGEQIVGYCTLILVLVSLTGLVLWWPRKLIAINPRSSWRKINFDLHSAAGFFSSILVLILAFTGLVITFSTTAIPLIFKVTGTPSPLAALPLYVRPEGARPLSADQLLHIAALTLPSARTTILPVPRVNDDPYIDVIKWQPGDDRPGHSLITVNEYTGEVARVVDGRHLPAGTAALNLNRELHFGDVYGLPTRMLACLCSASLLLQIVTGFTIWLVRYRNTQKAKVRRQANRMRDTSALSQSC